MSKYVWLQDELPLLAELSTQSDQLLADYLSGWSNIKEAVFRRSFNMGQWATEQSHQYDTVVNQPEGWRATELRFLGKNNDHIEDYPTAAKMVHLLGADCTEATYLTLAPHTEMALHRDYENRTRQSLRCHIPLMVPEGDCALEVEGRIYDHHSSLAFDNQALHRAWNRTDHWRLIFSLTVTRSRLGL